MMAARGFRHLPVLDAGKVVGVISIGDVVKDIIRNLERNVGDLMGYIMTDGPRGLTDEPRCRPRRCCRCPFRGHKLPWATLADMTAHPPLPTSRCGAATDEKCQQRK